MEGDGGHLDLNPPPGCEYEWWVVAPSLSLYFSPFLSLSHSRSLALFLSPSLSLYFSLFLSLSRSLSLSISFRFLSLAPIPFKRTIGG